MGEADSNRVQMSDSRPIAGLLAALVFAGCDVSGPGGSGGTWVLRSVAGEAMPARIHADESPLLVRADTLYVGVHDSRFRGPLARFVRWVALPGGPPSRSNTLYRYERVGDQVTLRLTCPSIADCAIDQRRGAFSADILTLEHTPSGYGRPFRSPLVYQRVR